MISNFLLPSSKGLNCTFNILLRRAFSSTTCCSGSSSIYLSFLGLLPILYGHSGQSFIGHCLTSLAIPQLQSRHFALIALIGVNTSGKTTIVRAFEWCLYGNNRFEKNYEKRNMVNIDINSVFDGKNDFI